LARLYPQARPAGNDGLGLDPVHDDQLLASSGAGDQADRPQRHVELVGEQTQQGVVGRPADRRCRHPRPEHPFLDAIDTIGPGSRCQSDGEANVGARQDSEQPKENGQEDEHDQRREIERACPGQRSAHGSEDRLGGAVDERSEPGATARIDPREKDPAEDQQGECDQRELEKIGHERHGGESTSVLRWRCRSRPLAEEGPADADDRRPLLDRDLEVVGHAHRELRAEVGSPGSELV